MRLPALLRSPAAAVLALATTAATTAAVQVATGGTAHACSTSEPSRVPISRDAPYDTPRSNAELAGYRPIRPRAGTDFGHLPRWKRFADGRVLLREDRVTVRDLGHHGGPGPAPVGYTTHQPGIRSYWLHPGAPVFVYGDQHRRITGRDAPHARLTRVGQRQFLDSFDVRGDTFHHYLKYRAVYRLTFDASRTRVIRVEELPQFFTC